MEKLMKEVDKAVDIDDKTPQTQSLMPETDLRGNIPGKEEVSEEVVPQTVKRIKNLNIEEIPIEQVNQRDKTLLKVNQSLEWPAERGVRENITNSNKGMILQSLKTVHQQRGTRHKTKGQRVPVQTVRVNQRENLSDSMGLLN